MDKGRSRPPDWQLPLGVDPGLWDYLHDAELAEQYDQSLSGNSLVACDEEFVACHCPAPGRLIDLGCGTGRTVIAAARRGCWSVGVDLSPAMLNQASKKARSIGVRVHFVQANIAELGGFQHGAFDYATCLFSTLGMVVGNKPRQVVLQNAWRLLRPGGKLILHVHNRWFNAWDPQGRRWLIRDVPRQIGRRPTAGDREMPVHQGIAGLILHLFGRNEICSMLKATGFQILEIRPVGLTADGRLKYPAFMSWLRAYGYLIACKR